MKKLLNFTIFILTSIIMVFGQEASPVVNIPDGQLQGISNFTVRENITYYAYRGIPYAKKPVGELRFASPVKNDPWTDDILDASKDKQPCTQMASPIAIGGTGQVIGSEDCLYINVYTTNLNRNLPVMVWIYGGGFNGGSSEFSNYGPDYFLEKDVIYVSFNYRLGAFGFLSTEDMAASGNWGLKDQLLALKWVKENVKYFGGDPEKITIFGESAGAASVSYLLQSNLTAGLYSGAIMESGSSLCSWALTRNARRRAFSVGVKLGLVTLDSQTLISNLRSVEYKALKLAENAISLQTMLTENILAGLPFGVVTEPDHPGAIFSTKSWQQFASGNFQKVPMIIGFNSNEGGSLTSYLDVLQPILIQYDLDPTRLPPVDLTQNWIKRLQVGGDIKRQYFRLTPLTIQEKALTRFFSVDQFERPIRETVSLASKYSKVFYYQFSYTGLTEESASNYEGVGHAGELKYLFVFNGKPVAEQDLAINQKFVTLWTNFAKTGDPTPMIAEQNESLLGSLTWMSKSGSSDGEPVFEYLNINSTLTMETNPSQSDWLFYERIYDKFGEPPYTTY